jgi:hypothetical protein
MYEAFQDSLQSHTFEGQSGLGNGLQQATTSTSTQCFSIGVSQDKLNRTRHTHYQRLIMMTESIHYHSIMKENDH